MAAKHCDLAAVLDYSQAESLEQYWLLDSVGKPVKLTKPLRSGLLGTQAIYYAHHGSGVVVSRSILQLARLLKRVHLNSLGVLELLLFRHTLHRDETLLSEVRLLPAGTTLFPDGTLSGQERIVQERSLADINEASALLNSELQRSIGIVEATTSSGYNVCGLSSGKDSRILAAMPKLERGSWHWLNIAGEATGEAKGGRFFAKKLRLENFQQVARGSCAELASSDFASGVEASNASSYAFETFWFRGPTQRYVSGLPPRRDVAVWAGTMADALIGPTWLNERACTVGEACPSHDPRFLPTIFKEEVVNRFVEMKDYYDSQPFTLSVNDGFELNRLLKFLTYGRRHICGGLDAMRTITNRIVSPFLLDGYVRICLQLDSRCLRSDGLRDACLDSLQPGLSRPNYKGFESADCFVGLAERLAAETRDCELLDGLLQPEFLGLLRAGVPPACLPFKPNRLFRIVSAEVSRAARWALPERFLPDFLSRGLPLLKPERTSQILQSLLSVATFLNSVQRAGVGVSLD